MDKRFWGTLPEARANHTFEIRSGGQLFAKGDGQLGDWTDEGKDDFVRIVAEPTKEPFYLASTLPIQISSRDRMLRGIINVDRFKLPDGSFLPLNITIRQQLLGVADAAAEEGRQSWQYQDVLRGGSASSPFIYSSAEEVLSESDVEASMNPTDTEQQKRAQQPVLFRREGSRIYFFALFDDLGDVEVLADYAGRTGHFDRTLIRDEEFSDFLNTADEHVHALDVEARFPPQKKGFLERSLTCKIGSFVFQSSKNVVAFGSGNIDGAWFGLKGDIDNVRNNIEWVLSPFQKARAIVAFVRNLSTQSIVKAIGAIPQLWATYLSSAEKAVPWKGAGDNTESRNAYIGGNVFGFGGEQIAAAIATAGLGTLKYGSILAGVVSSGPGALPLKGLKLFSGKLYYHIAKYVDDVDLRKVERMILDLEKARTPAGKEVGQTIQDALSNVDDNLVNHDIIALYLAQYAVGEWDTIGRNAYKRMAEVIERLDGGTGERSLIGLVRAYERLDILGDDFEKLFVVFRTQTPDGKKRLANALDVYSKQPSAPDPDLLTILHLARKDRPKNDHPALQSFGASVERLFIRKGETAYLPEAIAAARYELRKATPLVRPPPGHAGIDYVDLQGLRIDFKGPLLHTDTGAFDGIYDAARASGLLESVRRDLQKSDTDKIVVDAFGFEEREVNMILEELSRLQSTTSILIELQ
ncbi:MAG: hypothetical protein MN733_32855 [Nitrososphaera sp.]|nr:hypothetical protein [Nitrososphaera sp.]